MSGSCLFAPLLPVTLMIEASDPSSQAHAFGSATGVNAAIERYRAVRREMESLCETLEPEDYVLQAMPDASPTKWHLAHTTWFFETFVLASLHADYRPVREDANFLFNSYYNAIGDRIARDRRGLLSRPTVAEVRRYRSEVDRRVIEAIASASPDAMRRIEPVVTLGLNHEQQHQELLLTDIKAAFGSNPIRPVFRPAAKSDDQVSLPSTWIESSGGVRSIGHEGDRFAFDNELPRHRAFLEPFAIASRLATNGEYLGFIDDGGYERPEFWLSDGWAAKVASGWDSPLYWERTGSRWSVFTLGGVSPLVDAEPVVHLSFYEADAFARWSGARLPTEAEWETIAAGVPIEGNLLDSGLLHPTPLKAGTVGDSPRQLFGDVWEWTASPYVAYPGYRAASGALGEYNGKFMCNQMVLRGGSCATPASHIRVSYRNFFGPGSRWQFSGVRLAR